MDREDGLGAAGDLGLDPVCVDDAGPILAVHENRDRAGMQDGVGGRAEAHGRNQDLVPRPDPPGLQPQVEGARATGQPHGVLGSQEAAQGALEGGHFRARRQENGSEDGRGPADVPGADVVLEKIDFFPGHSWRDFTK